MLHYFTLSISILQTVSPNTGNEQRFKTPTLWKCAMAPIWAKKIESRKISISFDLIIPLSGVYSKDVNNDVQEDLVTDDHNIM